jgi:TRAP-type C4-dicarboxylate transport system permease small subunit
MSNETTIIEKNAEYKGVLKAIHVISTVLNYIELLFMVIGSILLFLNMTWSVVARYCLAIAAPYTEELSIMLYVWLTFWGVSYLISKDGHPSIEIFSSKVKKSSNKIVRNYYFTFNYAVMLFFVGIVGITGLSMMPKYISQKTISLGISYGFIYGMGIIVMLIMSVRCLFKIVEIWLGGQK